MAGAEASSAPANITTAPTVAVAARPKLPIFPWWFRYIPVLSKRPAGPDASDPCPSMGTWIRCKLHFRRFRARCERSQNETYTTSDVERPTNIVIPITCVKCVTNRDATRWCRYSRRWPSENAQGRRQRCVSYGDSDALAETLRAVSTLRALPVWPGQSCRVRTPSDQRQSRAR